MAANEGGNDVPGMEIEVRGHTDDVGDAASNQILSEARTQSVYKFLVAKGIDSKRMKFKGLGESNPLTENTTAEGKQVNRRVEFTILKVE